MRRSHLAALTGVLLAAAANVSAKGPAPSPSSSFKGVYNCQLSGGFVAQPGSTALMQFTVDGKGGVTTGAAELHVAVGQVLFSAAVNGFTFLGQQSTQSCLYTISQGSPGSYAVSRSGDGALIVSWTPNAANQPVPIDCSGPISTHFDMLLNSPTSLMLMSTDSLTAACGATANSVNYPNCGSTLTGSCQQQSAKP